MKLDLVEDDGVKQFSFSAERQNIASDKVISELRAISMGEKFVFQLHPKNFQECKDAFTNILENGNALGTELNITHHRDGTECSFCGKEKDEYVDVPVSLNIGTSDNIYPSVASSEVQVEMCKSCMNEIVEEIERISEERRDIILAHEI